MTCVRTLEGPKLSRRLLSITTKLLAILLLATTTPADESPPPKPPRLFLSSGSDLARTKLLASSGDPQIAAALKNLRQSAEAELKSGPYTVVNKPKAPPSGDKHDYLSMAP